MSEAYSGKNSLIPPAAFMPSIGEQYLLRKVLQRPFLTTCPGLELNFAASAPIIPVRHKP